MQDNKEEMRRIAEEIDGLKQLLKQSDYKALKHADGALTDEEYAADKAARAEYRAKINELEEQLQKLKEA